jgi:hypothetical protein
MTPGTPARRFVEKFRRPWGRRRTVAGVVVASLCLGTAAAAYWSVVGAGGANTVASTAQAVTVTPGTPTTRLYPGAGAGVAASMANANPFPVRVSALTLDTTRGTGGFAVDAGHSACGVGSLTYTSQSNGGAGWTVPPRVGAVDGTLAVDLGSALAMSVGALDSCQGATFTVYLAATAS